MDSLDPGGIAPDASRGIANKLAGSLHVHADQCFKLEMRPNAGIMPLIVQHDLHA
jgi:hypothetical protein